MPILSGYHPLRDYLAAVEGHEAARTFMKIEAILDAAPPLSALTTRGF